MRAYVSNSLVIDPAKL